MNCLKLKRHYGNDGVQEKEIMPHFETHSKRYIGLGNPYHYECKNVLADTPSRYYSQLYFRV